MQLLRKIPFDTGVPLPKPDWVARQEAFGEYIICELRAGGDLLPEAVEWLIDGLAEALPRLKIRSYFSIRRSSLVSCPYLTVAVHRQQWKPIALQCSRWYAEAGAGRPFLHASICLISDQHQQTLLFRHLWRLHLRQVASGPHGFPVVIALKTYNPAVYSILSSLARLDGAALYPRIDGAPQAPSVIPLVTSIQSRIAAGLEFDFKTGVIRRAGTPLDFYPQIPSHRRVDICGYFSRNLCPGDRLLCVLTLPESPDPRPRLERLFGGQAEHP